VQQKPAFVFERLNNAHSFDNTPSQSPNLYIALKAGQFESFWQVLIMILGIDEVGRGCLAGGVSVGGVLIPVEYPERTYKNLIKSSGLEVAKEIYQEFLEFREVYDSKILSQAKREQVYDLVIKKKLAHLVLSASAGLIDQFSLGVCLGHLVFLICLVLSRQTKVIGYPKIIIDGQLKPSVELNKELLKFLILENDLKELSVQNELEICESFLKKELPFLKIFYQNKADSKFLAVAIASCVAKVQRDWAMVLLDKEIPGYFWNRNKGYGTLEHRKAIFSKGLSKYHRKSFKLNLEGLG
jgi:ribonuclease HII